MCNQRMGRDLESFGKPILIVGDPYQLKPVYGDGYYDLSNPDVPLTKIYRQHEGSGILALATAIREGRKISRAELGPDVSIIKKSRLKPKQTLRGLLWPGRIITATNDTRLEINGQILGALGFGPYPAGNQGEKLICLQNYADAGLFNGTPVRLTGVARPKSGERWFTACIERDDGGTTWTDCGEHKIYLGHFNATALGWTYRRAKHVRRIDDLHIDQHGPIELDWAFATTCHKAQGSEWEKVLIIDEGWPTNRADVQRWRYTAATRARSKLVIMDKWNLS